MEKLASKIFLVILITLFAYFLYSAVTTTPEGIHESDSLAYHIPIATELSKFSFIPPGSAGGLGFYPGSAETILALFMLLHLPLNLFGVLGWVLLIVAAYSIGKIFGLSKYMSIVYAGSFATLQSVLRWPLTQTVDVWLVVFFLMSLYYLKKGPTPLADYLKAGISLGLLIGAKYSGILFSIPLLILFGKSIFKNISWGKSLVLIIPVILFGFSWYIRNYLLTGNPFYPANGAISFFDWTLVGNVLKNPSFFFTFLQSFNTEFLFWSLSILFAVFVLIKRRRDDIYELALLGIFSFLIFAFILPYWMGIDVSNLRFLYPALAPFMLSVFVFFKQKPEGLIAYALINTVFAVMNLAYRPKILLAGFIVAFIFIFLAKTHEKSF